jgi:hypothetical protein
MVSEVLNLHALLQESWLTIVCSSRYSSGFDIFGRFNSKLVGFGTESAPTDEVNLKCGLRFAMNQLSYKAPNGDRSVH